MRIRRNMQILRKEGKSLRANNEVLNNHMIEQIVCMRSKAKLKWGYRHEERKKERKITCS